jgi:deazaflavin-dependent oxidoreductase (nitroreductase family)
MNPFLKLFVGTHIRLFRWSGGRIGGRMMDMPALLLTTTGRKTGQQRTVPLMSLEEDGQRVVIASAGGSPKHPAWFNNLVANPDVTVEVRGRRYPARAEVLLGADRERLFNAAVAKVKRYGEYQKMSGGREIPVVLLRESRTTDSV